MSILETVKQSWVDLPEKEKKIFFKTVYKKELGRFKEWINAAGLSNGFRIESLAKREAGAKLLDKVFFEFRNSEFAKFRLKNFFCNHYPQLNDDFLKLVKDEKADCANKIEQLLITFREANSDNPFIDLFCSASTWMVDEWYKYDNEFEDYDDQEEDSNYDLIEIFQKLECLPSEINDYINDLAVGLKIDFNSLILKLQNAFEAGESLRGKVYEAAGSVGIETSDWHSREEFNSLIASIREKKNKLLKAGNLSLFYKELKKLLAACKIVHKSQATRLKWESIKDKAQLQLGSAIESCSYIELPKCKELSPMEWIEWSLTLSDSALDELIASLESSLSSLGQLICEVERHHLEFVLSETVDDTTSNLEKYEPEELVSGDSDSTIEPDNVEPENETTEEQSVQVTNGASDSDVIENNDTILQVTDLVIIPETNCADVEPIGENNDKTTDFQPIIIGEFTDQPVQEVIVSTDYDSSYNYYGSSCNTIIDLLDKKKVGLAYNYAKYYELTHEGSRPAVASDALQILALSQYLISSDGEIAKLLKKVSTEIASEIITDHKKIYLDRRLFFAAAMVRPSLLAPMSNAGTLLKSLRIPELHLFDKYCQHIAQFSEHQLPLDIVSLSRVKNAVAWQSEVSKLRSEVQDWLNQAPSFSMVFGPAKKVWLKWFEKKELINRMLEPIIAQDESKLDSAKQLYETFLYDSAIDAEVERTDKKIRSIRRSGDAIEARALHKLRESVGYALKFLKKWINLIETRPGQNVNFKQSIAEDVRAKLNKIQDEVLLELTNYSKDCKDVVTNIAVTYCFNAVNDIKNMFQPDNDISESEPQIKYILNSELLKNDALSLNDSWEPTGECPDLIFRELEKICSQSDITWKEVFQKHSMSKKHDMTDYILELLRNFNDPFGELEELDTKRRTEVEGCLNDLDKSLHITRQRVEEAFAFGLITDFERSPFIAEMEEIYSRLYQVLNFSIESNKLASILDQIEQKREQQVEDVRKEMKKRGIDSTHPAWSRIEPLLESGDVLTANEYIEMICSKQDLPVIETTIDHFRAFFPDKAASIEKILTASTGNPSTFVRKVRERSFPDIEMRLVPGAQADQAAEMLEQWYRIKRDGRMHNNYGVLENIFSLLGFSSPKMSLLSHKPRYFWVNCTTDVIHDKSVCPISTYGSNAEGKYRLLCCWDRPSEEELASWVGDTSHGAPVIVLHFGCMSEQRRRDLAKLCRREIKTFLMIDDVLMVYLCGVRGMRLPVLFSCSLPFTYVEPYITTGGLVPAEMFFGRQRERNSIISDAESSASVIYGGRQLGKTALLKEVERSFESLSKENKALYIDLKGEDIGYGSPIDDIWAVIIHKLKLISVLPPSQNANIDGKRLSELIESWLRSNSNGRIVLLLDEADRFLESDGKEEFKRTAILKNLMEKTNRKFKVVFSGLHNVQRTAKQNDPIAHLGDPICIGPLLNNGEWREARALIEVPFANMGYYFEVLDGKQDLVTRILSQTNYYPSLIQLYCKQLLKHINSEFARSSAKKSALPFKITAEHVDDAYRDQDLQKAIRHRFMLTLRLDPRYEVIAYAIAFGFLSNGKNMTEGYALNWIRSQALYWWEEGFRNCYDLESFRVLVDEMVGLGVLRITQNDHYTFRSLNVISLMGNQDDIADALEMKRELPPEYEPAIFRKTKKINKQLICNPFTSHEESRLKSHESKVVIVVGSKISGIEYISDFLSGTFDGYFSRLDAVCDNAAFNKQLESITQRKKDGTSIYLVNHTSPWSNHWVASANEKLRKLKSKDSCAKVVFVADPRQLQYLVDNNLITTGDGDPDSAAFIYLKPLHNTMVNHWLQEGGLGPYDNQVEEIAHVTGNWPQFVYEFQKLLKSPHLWRNDLTALENRFGSKTEVSNIILQLGIDTPEVLDTLYTLALLETMDDKTYPSTADIQSQLEGSSIERVENIVQWASMLSYVTPAGRDGWKMNPTIKRFIISHKEE